MQSRVANVYCQFDNTWNQLKHKHLATNVTNVGDFLDWIIWHGKTHPNLLVAFHINEHGRRKIYLFVCLPLLPMTSSSVLLLKYSLAGIRTDFFRIPMQTEDQQLSANPLEPSTRQGLRRHPASWTEQMGFLIFSSENRHWGTSQSTVCKPL